MQNIIKDDVLRAQICKELGIEENQLDTNQLMRLTEINFDWNYDVSDLNGIEHATSLKVVRIKCEDVVDCSPLLHLPDLEVLDLWKGKVKDISELLEMHKLKRLDVSWESIERFPVFEENETRIPFVTLVSTFFKRAGYTERQRKHCEEVLFRQSEEAAWIAIQRTPKAVPFAVNYLSLNDIEDVIINQISQSSVHLQYLKELIQMPQVDGEELISDHGSAKARKWLMEKQLKRL